VSMEIFVDETGAFRPAPGGQLALSAVMAVIIPEVDAPVIRHKFNGFIQTLPRICFENGEPKGRLLPSKQQRDFAEILNRCRGLMIVPTTFNRSIDKEFFSSFPLRLRRVLEAEAQKCIHAQMKSEVGELARRCGNLNSEQLARLYTYKVAVEKTVNAVSLFYHCAKYHSSYEPIRVIFDRVGKPNNREELVFNDMVFTWVTRNMIPTIKQIHTEDHPFRKLYGAEVGGRQAFDLAKMLRGNFEFRDSKSCWQLQVADIAAAVWVNSVRDTDGRGGFRPNFRLLHRNASLTREQPLGLMSIAESYSQVDAPLTFNVFPGLVANEGKVLPCNWE
jgi:hypothetical protein